MQRNGLLIVLAICVALIGLSIALLRNLPSRAFHSSVPKVDKLKANDVVDRDIFLSLFGRHDDGVKAGRQASAFGIQKHDEVGGAPVTGGENIDWPNWNEPVKSYFDRLSVLASAGNVEASCHLALALTACSRVLENEPGAVAMNSVDNVDRYVNFKAAMTADIYRPGREQSCVGLTVDELNTRFDHLIKAADSGVSAAQLVYLEGLAFGNPSNLARHVDEVERYQALAPKYFESLMKNGYVPAAKAWGMLAARNKLSFMAQYLNVDAAWAVTFGQLDSLVSTGHLMDAPPAVDEQAVSLGTSRAQKIFQMYFSSAAIKADSDDDLLAVEECAQ